MLSAASTSHSSFSGSGQAAFLRRLAVDDNFRTELQVDPQAALAEYGLDVDTAQLPRTVVLPKEEALKGAVEGMKCSWIPNDDLNWYGFFGD